MKILRKWLILLPCIIFFSWLYVLAVWYGSMHIVSLLALIIFPFMCGVLVSTLFPKVLQEPKELRIVIAACITILIIWTYWIFWFDLTLNQTRWKPVDISFLPIDHIKISRTDPVQCLFLLLHPDRIIDFIMTIIKNGYFTIFGIRPSEELLFILLAIEWYFTGFIIYTTISPEEKNEKAEAVDEP